MRLLLVEDEALLSKSIAKGLQKMGYAVDCAYDGEEALELYELNSYDLMILDLNLPKLDGLDVLRSVRRDDSEMRILILSARSSVSDKIMGLDEGCNDYLAKPFDFGELEARIRSLLRMEFRLKDARLQCGELILDTAAKAVFYAGVTVELTKKEYTILEYLMYHQNRVVSPEELIEHVWNGDADPFSNSFRFHIHSLRKKLDAAGCGGYIATIRGQGYQLARPTEDKRVKKEAKDE